MKSNINPENKSIQRYVPFFLIVIIIFLFYISIQISFFMGKNSDIQKAEVSIVPTSFLPTLTPYPTTKTQADNVTPTIIPSKNRVPVLFAFENTNRTFYCDEDKTSYVKDVLDNITNTSNNNLSAYKSCKANCEASYKYNEETCMRTIHNDTAFCLSTWWPVNEKCQNNCDDMNNKRISYFNTNTYDKGITSISAYCNK